MSPADCRLQLLFTPGLCLLDPWQTLAAAVRGGVDLVQWRSKQSDATGFATTLRLCQRLAVPLVVNDDVALALQHPTAGAHVGQDDMPAALARRLLVGRWLGISTHDAAQVAAAAAAGADSIGFGPCLPTATKGYAEGLPAGQIAEGLATARQLGLPAFAIGGITASTLPGLLALGVERIAVSSAILGSPDPAGAAAALRRLLPRGTQPAAAASQQ